MKLIKSWIEKHNGCILSLVVVCVIQASLAMHRVKIAIVGSGIAGSRLAQVLSKSAPSTFQIDVFEGGRSYGGRSSTRRHKNHGKEYIFDHGAQFIGAPKSTEFVKILHEWKENGVVIEWNGNFGSLSGAHFDFLEPTTRLIGSPSMNMIPKYMLDKSSDINLHFNCKVEAENFVDDDGCHWYIYDTKTEAQLGEWDILVSTDRNFKAVDDQLEKDFFSPLSKSVSNKPVIAAMISLSTKKCAQLLEFPFAGLQCVDHPIVSWIAQSSTQPGRQRSDGMTCWVVHSTEEFASNIIAEANAQGLSSEKTKAAVAILAQDPLFEALREVLEAYIQPTDPFSALKPEFITAHRWGAAFPKKESQEAFIRAGMNPKGLLAGRGQAYVDQERRFAAIGDYFSVSGEGEGRIEGSCRSAHAAADAILKWTTTTSIAGD